jgi:YD repeat-containing protein
MGRLYTLTDELASVNIIASASYGPANELLSMTAGSCYGNWGGESRTYNAMKQLTALSSNGVSLQYNYSSSQNNGKITSQYDTVSGETVAYTYDSLNRLATAAATSGGTWSQGYTYDGFGNLTAVTGTAAASYTYTTSTNQGYCADANGNASQVTCAGTYYGNTYDVENRIVETGTGDGPYFYSYAPGNKRVWRGNGGTTGERFVLKGPKIIGSRRTIELPAVSLAALENQRRKQG